MTAVRKSSPIPPASPTSTPGYRGYYYDAETGFYYLQSRYYDPAICRFINADTFATTDANGFLSANMFAYCENNPIMRVDADGEIWNVIAGAVIGAGLEVLGPTDDRHEIR